jgi:hypothetical protein
LLLLLLLPLQELVRSIRTNNDPPIPASRVLGMQNRSQVDEYMMAHPDGEIQVPGDILLCLQPAYPCVFAARWVASLPPDGHGIAHQDDK